MQRALRLVSMSGLVGTFGAFRYGPIGLVDALITLGAATIVPLGASLSLMPDRHGAHPPFDVVVARCVCVSALLVPITAWWAHGTLVAMAGGAFHVLATTLLAASALRRLAWRGPRPIDELAIDAGSLYLPVGAVFALTSRANTSLLGFAEPIVSFTAAHFHYAGFAAPIILGAIGRLGHAYGAKTTRVYSVSTAAVIAAIPLTAAGISGGVVLERAAAILLVLGMISASINALVVVHRRGDRSRLARIVLALSFLGLIVPMVLAAVFAMTGSAGQGRALSHVLSLEVMLRYHGAVNALVFAMPALFALSALAPLPRHLREGFAMSRLRGDTHIGADFFAKRGALAGVRTPTGIIDVLEDYASDTFAPSRVHEDVRRFYEHTRDYDLDVTPQWSRGFVFGGRLWRVIARRIGQVELPTEAPVAARVLSRIVDLRDEIDGRDGARGWVRTYEDTGRALYVAAYAGSRSGERLLMNIAFPLPFSALVSVLRFDDVSCPGGLRVTTVSPKGELVADEGIYLVTRFFTLRLPMTEWVEVTPTDTAGETKAEHALFVFGRRYLTLAYRIARARTSATVAP